MLINCYDKKAMPFLYYFNCIYRYLYSLRAIHPLHAPCESHLYSDLLHRILTACDSGCFEVFQPLERFRQECLAFESGNVFVEFDTAWNVALLVTHTSECRVVWCVIELRIHGSG